MIPFEDFGGQGPDLLLAHANGYPPGVYRPLAARLAAHYRVRAIRQRPLWPGSQPQDIPDWSPMADDLLQFLDEQGLPQVVGVGHSLGSVVSLLAALRRPERFRALVLLDPVLLAFPALLLWMGAYYLGLAPYLHPLAPATRRRRRVFADAEQMFAHYRRKTVFGRLSDHALRLYVEAAGQPRPDGQLELAYSPEWEMHVYLTGPLTEWQVWSKLKGLRVPVLVIRGAETDTFWPAAARYFQRQLPQARIISVPEAGHLVPMEKPDAVADAILEFAREHVDLPGPV